MSKSDEGRQTAEQILREHPEHKHLRVRAKGDLVTLESGPEDDPIPHVRFRRATVQWWFLEMPTHTGRWEKTPYRATMRELFAIVEEQFGWTLEPVDIPGDFNPERS
ncbi:MAG TPA: hypothetical protein VGK67_16325 [Myxococcales bacterium]|jgi:hypothetical protein